MLDEGLLPTKDQKLSYFFRIIPYLFELGHSPKNIAIKAAFEITDSSGPCLTQFLTTTSSNLKSLHSYIED